MKKIALTTLLLITVISLGACNKKDDTKTKKDNPKTTQNQTVKQARKINENQTGLYLVKIDNQLEGRVKSDTKKAPQDTTLPESLKVGDIDFSDICSGKIVEIGVDGRLSPREALEKLFTYPNNIKEGVYNAFSRGKNVKIDKLIIKNNFAAVTLSGDFQVDDGMCAGRLIHDQIEKTLSQFDDIAGVDIFVGDKEISEYLSTLEENN